MKETKKLSFVIPCYRSELMVMNVVEEIREKMTERQELGYEIVMINDQSPDNVWSVIKKAAEEDSAITVIDLAKNVGKHAALMAGYSVCTGDIIVNVDDDSQCPLNELWELLKPIFEEDYDISIAQYSEKKQSRLKNFGSWVNDFMLRKLLNKPKDLYISNFWAVKKYICDEMLRYKNPYPYVIGLYLRSTNRIANVPMEERDRESGTSGYTFRKSLTLWLDGFTAFSVKPLRFSTFMGFFFAGAGFIYAAVTVIRKLLRPEIMVGYSSLMAVLLFIGGMLMLMLGLIGEYLGRIYISINNSPQYVIREVYHKEDER